MAIDVEEHGEMIRGYASVEVKGLVHALASDYSNGDLPPDHVSVCGEHNFGGDSTVGSPVYQFRDKGYNWCEDCWSVAPISENL
jgi:hypothetical protein